MVYEEYGQYFGIWGGGYHYYIHKTKMEKYLDERQSADLSGAELQWSIAFKHADYVVDVEADIVIKKHYRVGDILRELLSIPQV